MSLWQDKFKFLSKLDLDQKKVDSFIKLTKFLIMNIFEFFRNI